MTSSMGWGLTYQPQQVTSTKANGRMVNNTALAHTHLLMEKSMKEITEMENVLALASTSSKTAQCTKGNTKII